MSVGRKLGSGLKFVQDFSVLLGKIMFIMVKESVCNIFPKKKKSLMGEIALITGGAHGMGRQMAIRCAELGAKVVIWDINGKKAHEVAEEIKKKGGHASWYVCDVTSEEEVKAKARCVEQEVGDVTILINNAGLMQNVPFLELDSAKIRRTLELNTLAHFWTIRAFLPKMQEKNQGHIVAMSSAAGLLGYVNQSDYSASKFGVVGLMESLSEEMRLKHFPIRFTTICPFTVNTGLNNNPVTKYPFLAPILSVEEAAEEILNAVRTEEFLVTLPRSARFFLYLGRLLPRKITSEVVDFLEYCRVKNSSEMTPEMTKMHTVS